MMRSGYIGSSESLSSRALRLCFARSGQAPVRSNEVEGPPRKLTSVPRLRAFGASLGMTMPLALTVTIAFAQPAGEIPGFEGNAGWINSAPLTPAQLRGKIVLVDFWEYTCINCLRTLPYLRTWYARYHKYGFVIVGVQTPEFGFSGERQNVVAATKRLGVTWPVVLDPYYAIWNRYRNDVWPHEFLFAPDGRLVHDVEGEGEYQDTESTIQRLLRAQRPHLTLPPVMALLPQDSYDKPGAVCYPRTPEILLEHETPYRDTGAGYQDGSIYLRGAWRRTSQAEISNGARDSMLLRYHAIQVMVVMKPEYNLPIRVGVTQNGKPVARVDAGSDIRYDARGNSYIDVNAPRSYAVIMNAHYSPQIDLRLSPDSAGLGIYDFAFESCEVPGSR